jgi:ferritin-like metal-binding protein YciE
MARQSDTLLAWLRDAHAMEQQAEQVLSSTANRIENYPELKARLESHCEQTRRRAELLRGCIEQHGSSTSAMKDTIAQVGGLVQAMSGLFVGDEVVVNGKLRFLRRCLDQARL